MQGNEVRNLLHPFLLLLILERPAHGYDLIERLGGLGVPDVDPGHVYRTLRSLERSRLVASVWQTDGGGPARRAYQLTAAGHAELSAWTARLAQLDRVIDGWQHRWCAATGTAGSKDRRHPPYAGSPR